MAHHANRSRPLARVAAAHRGLALLLLNVVLLLGMINVGACLILATPFAPPKESGPLAYGLERLRPLYPALDDEEIRSLLTETWDRTYRYEPFTQFRETGFAGRWVTIHDAGFRHPDPPPPWPAPTSSLFVFGGSTTFGYGVGDRETLPAALARRLEAAGCPFSVYNFGRANYYSTQERILFEQLVAAGQRPTAALFIDGLNDLLYSSDEPKFTGRLRYLMAEEPASLWRRALLTQPAVVLAKRWLPEPHEPTTTTARAHELATDALARSAANRKIVNAVGAAFGVQTFFAWQPVPAYGLEAGQHPFDDPNQPLHTQLHVVAAGYEQLAAARDRGGAGGSPWWLADVGRGRPGPLYVDRVHYTAAFADRIAGALAEHLTPALCPPE